MAGRRSKAEELGLLAKKKRLLKRMPIIGAKTTELDVLKIVQLAVEGQLQGLLSDVEVGRLHAAGSLALRALRQMHAHGDIDELEEILAKAEAIERRAAARGSLERNKTR